MTDDASKAIAALAAFFVLLWGFFRTFATQKDFDQLSKRVDDMEDKQQDSEKLIARLEVTIKHLELALRDLTQFLRSQNREQISLPHMMQDSHE